MEMKAIIDSKSMSGYRLSKVSGVPQTTVTDLIAGTTSLLNCSALTIYRLSHALGMSTDKLIETVLDSSRADGGNKEVFRSNVCHAVVRDGDLSFIREVLIDKQIEKAQAEGHSFEAFYLLGMVDYLCRINGLPQPSEFESLRKKKLKRRYFPSSLALSEKILSRKDETKKELERAIPEFLRFNIVEGNIRDVV